MIRQEIALILFMVSGGMIIMLAYDLLVVIRELVRRTQLLITLEDIIYWVAAAVCTFYVIYRINEGVIRGYAAAGLIGGAVLFQWSVGSRMVRFLIKCGSSVRKCLINIFYRCKIKTRRHEMGEIYESNKEKDD